MTKERKLRTQLKKEVQRIDAASLKGNTRKVDVIKALRMRAQGLSYENIGALLKVSATAVSNAVGSIGKLLDNTNGQLTAYREHEADILDAIRHKLIDAIYLKLGDEKLSKKIDCHLDGLSCGSCMAR